MAKPTNKAAISAGRVEVYTFDMYTELQRIKATQRYLDGEGLSLCQNKYRVLFFPMISGKCVAIILLMEIYFFFLCLKYLVNLGV